MLGRMRCRECGCFGVKRNTKEEVGTFRPIIGSECD